MTLLERLRTLFQRRALRGLLSMSGFTAAAQAVAALATLPSLDQLRGKIIGLLQAPATKVAGVLQAPAGQLARVMGAYAAKDAA